MLTGMWTLAPSPSLPRGEAQITCRLDGAVMETHSRCRLVKLQISSGNETSWLLSSSLQAGRIRF